MVGISNKADGEQRAAWSVAHRATVGGGWAGDVVTPLGGSPRWEAGYGGHGSPVALRFSPMGALKRGRRAWRLAQPCEERWPRAVVTPFGSSRRTGAIGDRAPDQRDRGAEGVRIGRSQLSAELPASVCARQPGTP